MGVSSCIDSDGYGVQANNIQRILFENDVVVLRLNNDELRDKLKDVEGFARRTVGTEYSIEEAKLALLKKQLEAQQPNRQFCTRFVAQAAIEGAGIYSLSGAKFFNSALPLFIFCNNC